MGVMWALEAEKLGFEKRNQGLGLPFDKPQISCLQNGFYED